MTRAAAYLRVSTAPQMQQFGPEVQRTSITKYAQQHGITITDWYEDAITGKTAKRDALNQLLDHAPRYEAVILSSVDRLARRVPIAYGVLGELVDTGLAVHSTDMGVIDLDDDSSSVQFGIRTLFADQDHRRITRRLHAARVAKVASGKAYWDLNGYGWRKGAADEVEQHWARWMYQRVQQVGVTTIANELAERGVTTRHGNPWTAHRVAAYLRNPTNKGVFQFGRSSGRILAAAPCPAIVDEDTWNRAQDALTSRRINRARYGSRTHLYPLNGRVICGECGKAMGGRTENGKNHYYRCSNAYQYDGRRTCNHRRYWPTADLHAGILAALADAAAHPDTLADLLRPVTAPSVDLAPLLADVDRRLARLDAAYEAGAYDVQEYVYKRHQLKQERDTLASTPTTPPPPPDTLSAAAALRAALDDVSDLHRVAEQTRLRAVIHADGQVDVTVDP